MNWTVDTPYLVIVNYYDHDVSWGARLKFPHLIYYKERPDQEPFSAMNKGKSETNLLKFVSDFYDQLPQNLIIVHQYERKFYHDGSLVDILNDPNFETTYRNSITPGFWNFNKILLGNVAEQIPRMMESGWWPNCMEKYFGPIQSYGDFTLNKKACAQFVVSRDRIRSLPREFYANMYTWMVEHTLDEEVTPYNPHTLCRENTKMYQHSNSNFCTSRYLEWTWELIFTSCKPWEDIRVPITTNIGSSDGTNSGAADGTGNIQQCEGGAADGTGNIQQCEKISAKYGSGNYYRNVTDVFIQKFVTPAGTIMIPPISPMQFNKYFGDTVANTVKTLVVEFGDRIFEVDERYNITISPST